MRKKILGLFVIVMVLCVTSTISFGETFDKYRVYYNGKTTGYYGFYIKGNTYLPTSMIGQYCSNPGVTVDEENMRLNINLASQNIMLADDEITAFVKNNAGEVYVPLKEVDDTIVFPINVMEQFFKTGFSVEGKKIKLLQYNAGTEKIARVSSNNALAVASLSNTASAASSEEDLYTEDGADEALTGVTAAEQEKVLTGGQRVYITGETDSYYKITDFDGNVYYTLKGNIKIEDVDLSKVDFYQAKKTKALPAAGQKINLAWQYVNEVTPEAPAANGNIDILAPTWSRLKVEGGGAVSNVGDRGYTQLAHQNGFKVWSTITNDMSAKGSTAFTTKMFATPEIMNKAIAQYIFYACLYDVDGINIDFEDVADADAAGLVNFTKSMRQYTERQGLVLSVDTLIPKPWTIEYDRKQLAKNVDFLAIMTYDEHYSSSETPGSIASLPWVEEAVQETLKEGVPKDKLLMGVPLYTRIWVVDSENKIQSASAATMDNLKKVLQNNNATITYLEETGQNYAEYPSGPHTAKVWIEDEKSISNRLNLIKTYGLAGSACWQYSQGTQEIWTLFGQYLK